MKKLSYLILLLLAFTACSKKDPVADRLIQRVSNGTAKNIETRIKRGANGLDYFEIKNDNGKIRIEGNNTISIATGFNWYLKYVAHTHIAWNSLTQNLDQHLPLPTETIHQRTGQHVRYYLNYCTFSYSMAFWDWSRWEKELDWMAMHGVNMALDMTGNAVVWRNVLQKLGYTKDEINHFIAGPAFQAWWQMNNLEGWGGPNPDEWYLQQEELEKKILARMKELGIQPILPGYAGMVPSNIGKKLGYQITSTGTWNGFDRPAYLSPEDPHFKTMAKLYYDEMEKLYGKVAYYSIDPFHEGGSSKGVNLAHAGNTIMDAMKQANPKAVWVIQGWGENPRIQLISNLKLHDLLVLDLYCDKNPQWEAKSREKKYAGHDWVYCELLNFGGRVGLHGRMDKLINDYFNAEQSPMGRSLKGVGVTAEAIDNNPVMYELLYELPWHAHRFTKEKWLKEYTQARYGKADNDVNRAWSILSHTSYNCPVSYPGGGTVESLFCVWPEIKTVRDFKWGSSQMYYDADSTREAARLMLKAAPKFEGNNNFEYDLIDIVRQSLADKGNDQMTKIEKAYKKKDRKDFTKYTEQFLSTLLAQDKLLASRSEFRVGSWIKQARAIGKSQADKDLYEWNAKTLITVWGPRHASEEGFLHDYSSREWNGVLGDLNYKCWKQLFDAKTMELKTRKPAKPIDFFQICDQWTRDKKTYDTQAVGNAIETAQSVYNTVFNATKN